MDRSGEKEKGITITLRREQLRSLWRGSLRERNAGEASGQERDREARSADQRTGKRIENCTGNFLVSFAFHVLYRVVAAQ